MTRERRIIFSLLLALAFIGVGIVVVNLGIWVRSRRVAFRNSSSLIAIDGQGGVPADSLPVDSLRVVRTLAKVRDPELDFSIVDLGLIKEIRVDSGAAITVQMILTMSECPLSAYLASDALAALAAIPGAGRVRVIVDPREVWDPSHLTGAARDAYRQFFHREPGSVK
jgi:metal-sulfur cluster biosynthetic enzyme